MVSIQMRRMKLLFMTDKGKDLRCMMLLKYKVVVVLVYELVKDQLQSDIVAPETNPRFFVLYLKTLIF